MEGGTDAALLLHEGGGDRCRPFRAGGVGGPPRCLVRTLRCGRRGASRCGDSRLRTARTVLGMRDRGEGEEDRGIMGVGRRC